MRVALVHDWLTGMRGGEKCLEALIRVFPNAEVFTLLHVPGSVSSIIERRPIHTSFVDALPGATHAYRYYLPLFPRAIERFDLQGFDVVVSTSHCVAKGVRPPQGIPHLCYCLTPMRYAWDLYDAYFGRDHAGRLVRSVMPLVARRLRHWDRTSLGRVRRFVTLSHHVREKIKRFYGRPAAVVYPPVAVDRFRPRHEREEFYLVVSALVPYKRIDLAIDAFNQLGRRLIVIGKGPELARLRGMAGPSVSVVGWLDDDEVVSHMERCRAFVFPGEEEFGITAVEAQAAGAPVIAYGSGGVTESVKGANGLNNGRGATGVFFPRQTPEALMAAVRDFEAMEFHVDTLRRNAERFRVEVFQRGLLEEVNRMLAECKIEA